MALDEATTELQVRREHGQQCHLDGLIEVERKREQRLSGRRRLDLLRDSGQFQPTGRGPGLRRRRRGHDCEKVERFVEIAGARGQIGPRGDRTGCHSVVEREVVARSGWFRVQDAEHLVHVRERWILAQRRRHVRRTAGRIGGVEGEPSERDLAFGLQPSDADTVAGRGAAAERSRRRDRTRGQVARMIAGLCGRSRRTLAWLRSAVEVSAGVHARAHVVVVGHRSLPMRRVTHRAAAV